MKKEAEKNKMSLPIFHTKTTRKKQNMKRDTSMMVDWNVSKLWFISGLELES